MRRTIYIVQGQTGEYSDRTDWPVAAYESEELAQLHVKEATVWARKWDAERDSQYAEPPSNYNPYDPSMKCDYTGTSYYYFTIELRDSVIEDAVLVRLGTQVGGPLK